MFTIEDKKVDFSVITLKEGLEIMNLMEGATVDGGLDMVALGDFVVKKMRLYDYPGALNHTDYLTFESIDELDPYFTNKLIFPLIIEQFMAEVTPFLESLESYRAKLQKKKG